MTFPDKAAALEIPKHRCLMENRSLGRSERDWRPDRTCWRCPDCMRWWVAKLVGSRGSISWHRVRPFTPTWFRIRKYMKKEMR